MLESVSLDVDLTRERMEEFGGPLYIKTDRVVFNGVGSMKYRQRSPPKASIIGVARSFVHPPGRVMETRARCFFSKGLGRV